MRKANEILPNKHLERSLGLAEKTKQSFTHIIGPNPKSPYYAEKVRQEEIFYLYKTNIYCVTTFLEHFYAIIIVCILKPVNDLQRYWS